MATIQIMDETLSNKIAAGEVVERPKSIVKELVENAIDAGGTYIKISIENSGISLISVEDNGKGMQKEDAMLSFLRHATSKIFSENDLFQIHSLGFRGEALAAIASVSDIKMYTGQAHAPSTYIHIKGGELLETEVQDERIGTKMVVTNLFYNTPARLKHLRSIQTEYMHTLEYLQKMAMTRTDIRFEFVSDGRPVFKTFGTGKLPETLVMIYGEKVAPMLMPLKLQDDDFKVTGYITKPQAQRSNQRVLNLSINGRSVRHYGISRAIVAGYSTLIPKGMYPIVALDITVDTQLVDVNVHPAKLEVRLSQERQLEELIKRGIQQKLVESNLIFQDTQVPRRVQNSEQMGIHLANQNNAVEESTARKINYPTMLQPDGDDVTNRGEHQHARTQLTSAEQQSVRNIYQSYERTTENRQQLPIREGQGQPEYANTSTVESNNVEDVSTQSDMHPMDESFGRPAQEVIGNVSGAAELVPTTDAAPILNAAPTVVEILRELDVIGQFDATYILAQRATSLYLIDQHAAQERIKYEEHMHAVRNMETITVQELLFPLPIRLDAKEMAAVKDFAAELDRAGVFIEEFGGQDIRVNAVPSWINKKDIENYVRKSVEVLVEHNAVDSALVREKELIMLSCKYSIKAHDVLNKAEMEQLIYRLSEMETPFTCPHGRPIIIEHTKYEVERWFKRV